MEIDKVSGNVFKLMHVFDALLFAILFGLALLCPGLVFVGHLGGLCAGVGRLEQSRKVGTKHDRQI